MYLIDCGSGWTRVEEFSRHNDDGLVHRASDQSLRSTPLAEVLAASVDVQVGWLDTLATVTLNILIFPITLNYTLINLNLDGA